jgi:beta-glucosidase-like glycosyl hydrolase/CubicO group peptidase (beta-lactamase class C family)
MKTYFYYILILFSTPLIVLGQEDITKSPLYVNTNQTVWVDSVMRTMNIDEKIGQLFAIDSYSDSVLNNEKTVSKLIEKFHVGTVIFFKGTPVKQAELTNRYQSLSKIPLLVAMDAERGVSMRLDKAPKLPYQIVIAGTNNVDNSYLVAEEIANECMRLGVNMNYAPVADVNINPENPIIGLRSFGEDKKIVSEFSVSALDAYRNKGVLSCGKHFPGHGDTSQDSHKTLPTVDASLERIKDVELYPFQQLIDNGIPAIMVAHLRVPALDKTPNVPTSLSPIIIDSLLKKAMGFRGLVISDALNMQGAQVYGTNVEINIQAFKAGNDILLFPKDLKNTVAKFKNEIKQKNISEKRLDESVRKILMAKYWVGLDVYQPVDTDNIISDLNNINSEYVNNRVASESLTLIKNNNKTLPIVDVTKPIANVMFGSDKMTELNARLNDFAKVDNFVVTASNFASVKKKLSEYSRIIISVDNPFSKSRRNKPGFNRKLTLMQSQIKELSENKIVILNYLGNPYKLEKLGDDSVFDAVLISYKNTKYAQKYSAAIIFGANSPQGVLPISINEKYKIGTSLTFNSIGRLSYSTPEQEGMSSVKLNQIDSIVNTAINDTVMPGAQVLVARNGSIIYQKSFGYKTYEKKSAINNNNLYDIASVTKIMATTPIVMKMVENGELDLDAPLKQYLPEIDTTSKADITIRQMMAHYARLWPWLPIYKLTLDEEGNLNRKKYYSFNYDSNHKLRVATNLYLRTDMKDSVQYEVLHSKLRDTLEYKYSDLPFYILQKIIEEKKKTTLDKLADDLLYKPLGLQRISYKPKNKFDIADIVPSEKDTYFRQTELQGDVNDAGAAMLGGVAGHAGIFSNSYDLAVIMQMYLQSGKYGGKRYLSSEIVNEFISCQYCGYGDRRGIGFDKPQLEGEGPACDCISYLSFGHTGFTGTMVWADPDENIVYIFLSNRTYPTSENIKLVEENIRTRIQTVIYDAINYAE